MATENEYFVRTLPAQQLQWYMGPLLLDAGGIIPAAQTLSHWPPASHVTVRRPSMQPLPPGSFIQNPVDVDQVLSLLEDTVLHAMEIADGFGSGSSAPPAALYSDSP